MEEFTTSYTPPPRAIASVCLKTSGEYRASRHRPERAGSHGFGTYLAPDNALAGPPPTGIPIADCRAPRPPGIPSGVAQHRRCGLLLRPNECRVPG